MNLVNVLIQYQNINLDKSFSYYTNNDISLYSRVLINFNNKEIIGFVIDVVDTNEFFIEANNIKEIIDIIDDKPLINKELFDLSKVLSNKYLVSQIMVLNTMLPPGLKSKLNQKTPIIYDKYLKVCLHDKKLTVKQNEIYEYIKDHHEVLQSDLYKIYSGAIVRTLVKNNVLEIIEKPHIYHLVKEEYQKEIILSNEQQSIYEKILESNNNIFLLNGVTGSGKTEIYLKLAQYYLSLNKSVLVLVPEISLTLMMQQRFASIFKNKIAILHSKLNNNQKYQEYQKISNDEVKIIVGTRSSIFAPIKDLGLVIIDEEHDSSYKQKSSLNYHVHEVAKERIKTSKAKLLLASATPSIKSMTYAYKKQYEYLVLNNRYNNIKMPQIKVVDMNDDDLEYPVSIEVLKAMKHALINKKQVIVLYNRRGYHQFFKCRDCNQTLMCPNCDVSLTYHHKDQSLRCHHCHYITKDIDKCFYCHSTNLKKVGHGTQKIEEFMINNFKEENVLRIDQDSIKNSFDLESKLESFHNQEKLILVGTQMIAKGLDFRNVSLVVILNIDASIALNQYDASENAFSLLVQVAGRAGRSSDNSLVLIETFQPKHYVIQNALKHDVLGFYQQEMNYRNQLDYPPYFKMAQLVISSYDQHQLIIKAKEIDEYLNNVIVQSNTLIKLQLEEVYKTQKLFRYQIIIKYKDFNDINKILLDLKKVYSNKNNININIDIDS